MDDLEPKLQQITPGFFLTANEEYIYDHSNLKRSESIPLNFSCNCSICKFQTNSKQLYKEFQCESQKSKKPTRKGFTYFLEKLGEISLKCVIKLKIPDSTVYSSGKALFSLQNSTNHSLKYITSPERLTVHDVIKSISNTSKTRKREELSLNSNKLVASGTLIDLSKEVAFLRFMNQNCYNDFSDITAENEEGAIRVMSDSEFIGLLWKRPSNIFWKQLSYIQSVLKCKNGVGESFVEFFQWKRGETVSEEELKEENFVEGEKDYARCIFNKIHFWFKKYLNLYLLEIQAEFVRDDNGTIWLVYATNILVEPGTPVKYKPEVPLSPLPKAVSLITDDKELINHLSITYVSAKNPRTEKFSQMMKKECEKILDANKLISRYSNVEPDELTMLALKKLRPFTPEFFNEIKQKQSKIRDARKNNNRSFSQKTKISPQKVCDFVRVQQTKSSLSPKKTRVSWRVISKVNVSPISNTRPNTSLMSSPMRTPSRLILH